MIKIGIPETNYSTKDGWKDFAKYLFGENVTVINLNPKLDQKSGKYNKNLLPEDIDFVLFDGGADIHPMLYKEPKHPATRTNIVRDWMELIIFQYYLKLPTKFIGICRGSQFLNVLMGGTLHQDLWSLKKGHTKVHLNDIMTDTKFYKFLSKRDIRVNSLHHQAIKDLGHNLRPIMTDIRFGIVEGIESIKGDKIRAVQSHPEYENKSYEHRLEIMSWLFRKESDNGK
jgi:putative glutamine amidotransferase